MRLALLIATHAFVASQLQFIKRLSGARLRGNTALARSPGTESTQRDNTLNIQMGKKLRHATVPRLGAMDKRTK
jgi:hypothetical protein